MANRNIDPRAVYELMENDDGEIMALLYAGFTAPYKPVFVLNESGKNLELYRNEKDVVLIGGLLPESIEKLKSIKSLYVCELKYNEDEDADSEILYAYEATLKPTEESAENVSESSLKSQKESVLKKAKQAREKVLSKNK